MAAVLRKRTMNRQDKGIAMEGQLSLFDMCGVPEEPPVLLKEGQAVYVLKKGDIIECKASKNHWVCGEGDRGYG